MVEFVIYLLLFCAALTCAMLLLSLLLGALNALLGVFTRNQPSAQEIEALIAELEAGQADQQPAPPERR